MRAKRRWTRKAPPKQVLRFHDLDQAKSAVISSLPSKESQRVYRHAIDEFIAWYCSEPRLSFNKAVVTGIEFTWNRANSRPAPSMEGSRPSGALPMKPLTPVCSVQTWLLESVESKVPRTSAFG